MFARSSRPPTVVRIVLADDHALYREGLAMAIGEHDDLDLVGQAADGVEALALVDRLDPDVALLDVQMPGLDGLGVCERLAGSERAVSTRVVLLSAFVEPMLVARGEGAGAAGYLSKHASRQEICETVLAVSRGERRFPTLSDQPS